MAFFSWFGVGVYRLGEAPAAIDSAARDRGVRFGPQITAGGGVELFRCGGDFKLGPAA